MYWQQVLFVTLTLALLNRSQANFSQTLKAELRDEARDMFYHAYNAYMENAFPADELMPLSCRGRIRGIEPDRGDIDDALGNFSLTLVDSLTTLVVLGDLPEFERGVNLVIENVHFDHDIPVSVFETNIRMVGGLLSSHILAELLRSKSLGMKRYQGELLNMALDLGYRLLPAFNSTTGLPHPRVNLKYGIKAGKVKQISETCSSCAGTMILEFAALSRLSGEPIFEEKAKAAMDVLWSSRHRQSHLVGNVLNIHTGDWIRRDSGVGAGIDSYYEYIAKAYILLGDEEYGRRWHTHYSNIMKYIGQRHVLQDVHMHRPTTTSKQFIDALGAFWPGLQVLMGDLKPAIENHEVLYQVMQRHDFIPEAFTSDFQVHWAQHLLRPEFVESTYFLYRATGDPYYLEAGRQVLGSLQKHARVTCGYASIKDVRTMQKEDRMDSFVLAETFKYLYLLFSEDSDLLIDIDSFVFTTEGHLLPLSLARLSPSTSVPMPNKKDMKTHHCPDQDVEFALSCPSMSYLFPGNTNYAQDIRSPLANLVANKCPTRKGSSSMVRKLHASDFQSSNADHMQLVKAMGISIVNLPDGRVQLLHTIANAKTPEDGEEGLLFMQEMIDLSKQQSSLPTTQAKLVRHRRVGQQEWQEITAGPAQFGRELYQGFSVKGALVLADPITACQVPDNAKEFWGKIVIVERGECMFIEKARILEKAGAKGGIVVDNNKGTTAANSPLFSMSGDGTDDISIPMVFLFSNDAKSLIETLQAGNRVDVNLLDASADETDNNVKNDDEDHHQDITSPVRSFLEKSKRQVENYLRDKFSLGISSLELENQVPDHHDLDDDAESILINHDQESNTITGIVTDSEGVDHRFVKSMDSQEEDVSKMFKSLENFLNPDSAAIKKLIEHRVLKNPNLLSELLEVNFGDLLSVFKRLMNSKVASASLEAAYLHLLQIAEDEGAEGISKLAAQWLENDELVEAVETSEEQEEQITYQMKEEKSPSLRLRGMKGGLSDEELSHLLNLHIKKQEGDDDDTSKDEL